MSWPKALTSLIEYEEGHLTREQRNALESKLKREPKLAQELRELRLVKQGLKMHAPVATPADPERLTQSILQKLDRPHASQAPTFAEKALEHIKSLLSPQVLGWSAGAASLILAIVFGLRAHHSQTQLEALLSDQANEQLLFQVAKIAYQQERYNVRSRLEMSELVDWAGDMDVLQVIEKTGNLPTEDAYKEIQQNRPISDTSL